MLPARAQSIAVPVKIAALAAIALNVVALAACVSKCALPIVVNVVICFQIIQNFKMLLTKSAPSAIGGTGQLFLFAFPVNIPIKPQAYVPVFHW